MSKKNSTHTKALEKIASNPKKFGFINIVSSSIEVKLFDNRGRLIAEPDLVLLGRNGTIYIIEYKSNGDKELLKRANDQIQKAIWWYGRYTDIGSEKIKTRIISGKDPKYKCFFR